jgi:hypothetical protein
MVVYMTHPQHGTHIAYSQQEVEACQKNGWSIRPEKEERKTLTLPTKRREKHGTDHKH